MCVCVCVCVCCCCCNMIRPEARHQLLHADYLLYWFSSSSQLFSFFLSLLITSVQSEMFYYRRGCSILSVSRCLSSPPCFGGADVCWFRGMRGSDGCAGAESRWGPGVGSSVEHVFSLIVLRRGAWGRDTFTVLVNAIFGIVSQINYVAKECDIGGDQGAGEEAVDRRMLGLRSRFSGLRLVNVMWRF